jgi:hypothetical protein
LPFKARSKAASMRRPLIKKLAIDALVIGALVGVFVLAAAIAVMVMAGMR